MISRARTSLDSPNRLPARIIRPASNLLERYGNALPKLERDSQRLQLASTLLGLSTNLSDDESARTAGVAYLLAKRYEDAVASFTLIRLRTAADWNDLAAAHIAAGSVDGRPERWLDALAATDAALNTTPNSPESRFNRAVIAHALRITPLARAAWQRAFRLDAASPWALIAKRRLADLVPSDMEAWKAKVFYPERLPPDELARLAQAHPQTARRYADAVYLSNWATAMRSGDKSTAEAQLAVARTIARVVYQRGEPLLREAVAAIDTANAQHLQSILAGQLAYYEGRLALQGGQVTAADNLFRSAAYFFDQGRSPMSFVSRFWLASALAERQHPEEALRVLHSLLSSETAPFLSLRGHVLYEISLLDAARGHWSASLDSANQSAMLFTTLGERGNVGNAHALLSEDYDLLGQADLARQHALMALRESAAEGAFNRTRVTLAALCRTELRAARWERARALTLLEGELALVARDARLNPDMFLRRATAEWHNGKRTQARYWMRLARTTAGDVHDEVLRGKLLADIDGVEGALERTADPQKAITLLSAAIVFQNHAVRPIVLPELYLERGRTRMSLGDFASAEADFEAGISELERQREHTSDVELRPGIFESASALFDVAIELQTQLGRPPESIWRYVERGRARTVLEQIDAVGDKRFSPESSIPSIPKLQRRLPANTALVEYVPLPNTLLVFVITRDSAVVHRVTIDRAGLQRLADQFVENRGAGGSALYDILIAPLQPDLRDVSALNIAVDDVLQRVPFAALFDSKVREFLIQRFSLATTPSAGVFLTTLARTRSLSMSSVPRIAVFANPKIPRDEFGDLLPLSAAESEANGIVKTYSEAATFIGDAATAEKFCSIAPRSEIVHFAGHGVIQEREPYASALVCAATSRRRGAVTVRDIAQLRFDSTHVVVLAACSTLTGRNAAVEGVPSIGRAFIVAGVPAVIGTLWDVEDANAAPIMRTLHQNLARHASADRALRDAQLQAIKHGVAVEHWSAFSLLGSSGLAHAPTAPTPPPHPPRTGS
ncbi:MAG TPA: CHAT domain-containing protein [Thermoanaerobaculia bacterium]|nr:CHAT domain-containing protein [Thermoanaerobaculia bacterium]